MGVVVKSGVVVGARKFGAQPAIAVRGRGMLRGPAPAKGGAPVGKPVAGSKVCYGCGKAGHLRRNCGASGRLGASVRPPFQCWGCGVLGHGVSFCTGRSLPVMNAEGVPVPVVGSGTTKGGVKSNGGHLASSEFRGRPFGSGSILGYLGGSAGRDAAAHHGARA